MLALAIFLAMQLACVEVPGDKILAGDLAAVAPVFRAMDPGTPVGFSPVAGIARWLTKREILRAVGTVGREAADVPERVCVIRKARVLSVHEVLAAMREALPGDAIVEVVQAPDIPVPVGKLEFPRAGIRPSQLPEVLQWKGRVVPEGGGRSVPVAAMVRIRMQRALLVARRKIRSGETVRAGDLEWETRKVSWPAPPGGEEGASYSGWKLRRSVTAGEVVDRRWLEPPLAAAAGSSVTVLANRAGAQVRVETVALTGGRVGETILLKSPFQAGRIRARLTGPGEAILVGRSAP